MIDNMVEVIPQETQAYRTILPTDFVAICKEYQENQYKVKSETVTRDLSVLIDSEKPMSFLFS